MFRTDVAEPLGADFHIGAPPEVDDRYAGVIPPPPLDTSGVDLDSFLIRALSNPPLDAAQAQQVAWRRAEIPAAGGTGNARAVGTVQRVIACGGSIGDVTLLSESGVDRIFREQAYDVDVVLGVKLRHGIGYGLNSPDLPVGVNERTCFWGGWGGSLVVCDLERRMCFAYVMNKMGAGTVGDERGIGLLLATHGALAAGERSRS